MTNRPECSITRSAIVDTDKKVVKADSKSQNRSKDILPLHITSSIRNLEEKSRKHNPNKNGEMIRTEKGEMQSFRSCCVLESHGIDNDQQTRCCRYTHSYFKWGPMTPYIRSPHIWHLGGSVNCICPRMGRLINVRSAYGSRSELFGLRGRKLCRKAWKAF